MFKTLFIYGAVSGAILAVLSWLVFTLCFNGHITLGQTTTVGYAGMLIALSMIFFGIKSYKDNQGGGSVSFWKAVQIGLMITLLASIIHSVSYQAYHVWNPEFREFYYQKFTEHLVSGIEQPATQEAIDGIKGQLEMVRTISENPLLSFLFSIVTLLPVGVVVTFVSAFLLRTREPTSSEKSA
jgi:hypothetical protein